MKTDIKAGWLNGLKDLGKLWSGLLFNGLTALIEAGLELEGDGPKEDDAGNIIFRASTGPRTDEDGKELKPIRIAIKCIPVRGRNDLFDMYIKTDLNNKKGQIPHVKKSEFDSKLVEWLEKTYPDEPLGLEDTWEEKSKHSDYNKSEDSDAFGDEDLDSFDSSKHMRVSLQKVTANRQTSIKCCSVMTNYDPFESSEDLTMICDDSEFCDSLNTVPTVYDIVVTDDGFDIQESNESIDVKSTYETLIIAAYQTLFNLQNLHWNVIGKEFLSVHSTIDSYIYSIYGEIDFLAETALQTVHSISNPADLVKAVKNVCPEGNTDIESTARLVNTIINQYLSVLEFFYPNVPHEVQSVFDEWIKYWKTESEYKFSRIC